MHVYILILIFIHVCIICICLYICMHIYVTFNWYNISNNLIGNQWIVIGPCKCVFTNLLMIFLNWDNKMKLVPGSFSCFLDFSWKNKVYLTKCYCFDKKKIKKSWKPKKNSRSILKSPLLMCWINLLSVFYKLFCVRFCDPKSSEKVLLAVWEIFYMEIILTIIPTIVLS